LSKAGTISPENSEEKYIRSAKGDHRSPVILRNIKNRYLIKK